MAKFHPLKVSQVNKETDDCVSIQFDVPKDLHEEFRFIQGQHLTLMKNIEGQDVRRSYSICSSPLEGKLKVAIKKVDGGQFSTFANEQLEAGEEIEVMPPTGHFNTPLDTKHTKNYLAIAAGSGITPVISILKTILAVESGSTATLVYGNRGAESIIFLEELESLKNKYLGRFSIHHFFSRESVESELFNGRLTHEKISETKKIIDYSSIDEAFICGPEEMMADTSKALKELGLNDKNIHLELFTSPVGKLGTKKTETTSYSAVKSEITILLDGLAFDFPLNSEEAILDAANKKGADLPFSCKGGVCSTCKAKLMEGEVEMTTNYALEPDEVEAGYILTCQAHPTTKKVVISFDHG